MTNAPREASNASKARKKALLGFMALSMALAFAGWNLSTWPDRIRYPGDWSSVEGIPLVEMLHLSQGVPIYSSFSPNRFDAANYGPFYYLIGAQLIGSPLTAYLPLRLVSVLATLGCAAACALLAFLLSKSYFATLLAPLLFLAWSFVTYYGTSARCDSLALLLFFLGSLAAFRLERSRLLPLAAPLMLLGFFYKQQVVAGPFAVVLSLLLKKEYRRALEFGAALGLGGLGLLGFFQFVAFPGQAFLQHFLGYNLLSFSATRLASGALIFGIMFLVPLLVGFELLRVYPDTFLRCYLGCAAVLALLAMGRQGSDTNYFLECALILSPLFAALLAKRIAEPARAAELLALLAVTLLVGQLFAPGPPLREDIDRDRAVQDYLRHNFSPGTPALSYYTGDLMRAGLEIPISNLFHYVWLIRKGTFSEQALVDQLRDRRFPAIVVYYDLQTPTGPDKLEVFLTEGIRQAILANYQLATSLEAPRPERIREGARFDVWVPRPKTEAGLPTALQDSRLVRHR